MSCIFCKILGGEIPSDKVFENDNFIVILDAFPANKGHCLVIPKLHKLNIFEIEPELLKEGFFIAQKVAKCMKNSLNIEDINILQNNGNYAGQTVNHFHIHVIPRKKDDTVTIKSELVNISDEDKENVKNLLKSALV